MLQQLKKAAAVFAKNRTRNDFGGIVTFSAQKLAACKNKRLKERKD